MRLVNLKMLIADPKWQNQGKYTYHVHTTVQHYKNNRSISYSFPPAAEVARHRSFNKRYLKCQEINRIALNSWWLNCINDWLRRRRCPCGDTGHLHALPIRQRPVSIALIGPIDIRSYICILSSTRSFAALALLHKLMMMKVTLKHSLLLLLSESLSSLSINHNSSLVFVL